MKKTYSIKDVLERVPGLTRRKVGYWIEKGYLGEVGAMWSGDNFQYRFTEEDIKVLRKIQRNLDKGWTLKAAAQKAQYGISSTP